MGHVWANSIVQLHLQYTHTFSSDMAYHALSKTVFGSFLYANMWDSAWYTVVTM